MDNFHSNLESGPGNTKHFGNTYSQFVCSRKRNSKNVYLKNILGAFDFITWWVIKIIEMVFLQVPSFTEGMCPDPVLQ